MCKNHETRPLNFRRLQSVLKRQKLGRKSWWWLLKEGGGFDWVWKEKRRKARSQPEGAGWADASAVIGGWPPCFLPPSSRRRKQKWGWMGLCCWVGNAGAPLKQIITLHICKLNQRVSCDKETSILSHFAFFWTATLSILIVLIYEIYCIRCTTKVLFTWCKWIPTAG